MFLILTEAFRRVHNLVLQGGVVPGEAPRGLARKTEMLLSNGAAVEAAAAERLRGRKFLGFLQLFLSSH